MKRKIKISLLITLCVALMGTMLFWGINAFPKAEATEREITASGTYGDVSWTLYDDGELYIYGEGNLGTSNVPWGKYYSSVTKLSIGKDVVYSEDSVLLTVTANGYANLELISVEEGNKSLTVDENGVLFNGNKTSLILYPAANALQEYQIPDSVTNIKNCAFHNAKVTKITMSNSVESIGNHSFYQSSLETIELSENLESIGNYAFYRCTKLSDIEIPDLITYIPSNAFASCNNLINADLNSCTIIGLSAFENCSKLETVILSETTKTIGEKAFKNCRKLVNIELPQSLDYINAKAFYDCVCLKSLSLPETMIRIEKEAFCGCINLESINIPDGITSISNGLFQDCEKLKNVQLPASITSIGSYSFKACKALTAINIPDNVTQIGALAFYQCTNLECDINISKALTNIGTGAFRICNNIKSFIVDSENTNYSSDENGVLFDKDKTVLLQYPAGNQSVDYIVPDTVNEIGDYAFWASYSLKNITVPDTIEYVGEYAFTHSGFSNDLANWDNGFLYLDNYLVAINIEEVPSECKLYSKTKLIAEKTFYNNDNITKVTMSDDVEYINDFAFYDCDNLQTISLSNNLKNIGASAFSGCSALSDIKIPENVALINEKTFYNCSSLESVTLNEGLTEIGSMAFGSTASLTEIYIPQTVISLAYDAFKSSGIADIYYGDSKAEWKRLANGATFNDATVHYTLRSDDESVIINHTDDNFDYEAGNVHLVVTDLGKASSSYEQNGFYNRLMANPIQVLDIKLVDGDGNNIQPLSDETITVKIKASEEFMNLMKSGLAAVSEYDIKAENIDFSDDCFVFENNGETISVPAAESFLKKFKIIHWYSDAVEPTDHESFTHDELSVENGYIVLETDHFSEYAVCTEFVEFELGEIELANGESSSVSVTVSDGTEVTYTSSDESVVTVDENGVITAVGPGTAAITVTINGTNISDTCEVTVPARDFTIKWIVDDVETEQTVSEQAVIIQPEAPEKEGCTFVGWTPSVPDTMPAQNIEFTAVWQVNQYTITFDTAGGSAVAPITLAYGSEITAPETPVLDGYIFKGWTPAIPETMPAYDMTLTAVYEKVFVSEINIISLPNKTQYTYRIDSLDLSGIAIQVVYSDGSKEVITDTNAIKAYGFSADSTGTKTVTVEYGGCTAKFDVTVSYAWWQWIIRILLLGFLWY